MGKRGKQPWSRAELPIGTIRIRKHSKHSSARMIKVANDGPKGRRWMTVARYWWLQNRGPIPPGMRVVHKDGNPLNDAPTNYILATAGDVAYLAREWDPDLDRRNAAAVRKAMQTHNRDRAMLTRALTFLPTRWYAVDTHSRIVINRPHRSRLALWRKHVDADAQAKNGSGLMGAWLGWPDVGVMKACILTVLHDSDDSLSLPDIVARVQELRALHGISQVECLGTFNSEICHLRKRGWVLSWRRIGESRRRYRIAAAAVAAMSPPCPLVAARGSEIEERFPGFEKLWPEQLEAV